MIISLSGAHGSGKSTIAQKLADSLAWPRYYMGGLRREAAAKKGLTLAEYNKLGETDIETDQEVDTYQKKLGEENDNFIIEGRTSWYFIPHSIKIYLDVDEDEGARRVFSHLQQENERNEGGETDSVESVKNSLKKRLESDNLRYKKYYGIDVYVREHYDFYLNTTNLSPEESFQQVYSYIKKRLDKC
ncbi:MAG: cytidylate kinase family protein [Patescibacteria group bacterium]|nr:cytidylate kinase family protein [Patescibacteria group bacterium]